MSPIRFDGYALVLQTLCVCLLLFSSCLDTIELPQNVGNQEDVVIDARLYFGDTSRVVVSVAKLFNFQANQTKAIAIDQVNLVATKENQIIPLKPVGVGRFQLVIPPEGVDGLMVTSGTFYHIEILTKGGIRYESESEQAVDAPAGQVSAELGQKTIGRPGEYEETDIITFWIDTPINVSDDGQLNRFRYWFERAFKVTDNQDQICYVTSRIDVPDLVLFDATILRGPTTAKIELTEQLLDSYFAEGYYLRVFQESLTSSAFRYWQDVLSLLERDGSTFEPPVGQVRGNFSSSDANENVIGYFYATRLRTYRIYISPEHANNPIRRCPVLGDYQPLICTNCPHETGSSIDKPPYWVDD